MYEAMNLLETSYSCRQLLAGQVSLLYSNIQVIGGSLNNSLKGIFSVRQQSTAVLLVVLVLNCQRSCEAEWCKLVAISLVELQSRHAAALATCTDPIASKLCTPAATCKLTGRHPPSCNCSTFWPSAQSTGPLLCCEHSPCSGIPPSAGAGHAGRQTGTP